MQNSKFALGLENVGSIDGIGGADIIAGLGVEMGNLQRDVVVVVGYVGLLFAVILISPGIKAAWRQLRLRIERFLARKS